uniref:Elongation of very long chain fatty acids protein n=1 Tax=Timema shepardi TaxID=629360 RepID=A0A7R9BA42_TIMSH|nr:unnamed protein product [Timema shepardi]
MAPCIVVMSVVSGGHGTMVGLLNTLVHMIMYSYYLISSLGPQYQKYLWWKKYLTMAQMTQFLIIIFHTGQILFTDCDYTKFCNAYLFFNSIFFFAMFASFYRKTYLVQKNQIKPD